VFSAPVARPALRCVLLVPLRLPASLFFPFPFFFYYRSVAGPRVLWQFGSLNPATLFVQP